MGICTVTWAVDKEPIDIYIPFDTDYSPIPITINDVLFTVVAKRGDRWYVNIGMIARMIDPLLYNNIVDNFFDICPDLKKETWVDIDIPYTNSIIIPDSIQVTSVKPYDNWIILNHSYRFVRYAAPHCLSQWVTVTEGILNNQDGPLYVEPQASVNIQTFITQREISMIDTIRSLKSSIREKDRLNHMYKEVFNMMRENIMRILGEYVTDDDTDVINEVHNRLYDYIDSINIS